MKKLRTIVLEDDPGERAGLIKILKHSPELELVCEAATVNDAYQLILETRPDTAFIDIKLIGGDVFAVFKRLQANGVPLPYSVVTTAYPDEYAQSTLNDHRLFLVQFLAKPFLDEWQAKLRKSIDALLAAKWGSASSAPAPNAPHYIFISDRGNLLRLDFDKIAYLEAAGGGETYVVTDTDTHQVDLTLSKFLEMLPPARFQRISRVNIINPNRILRVHRADRTVEIWMGAKRKSLGVGDGYFTELLKSLPIAKEPGARPAAPKPPTQPPEAIGPEVAGKDNGLPPDTSELVLEKQKNEDLLRQILPPDVADEFERTRRVMAKKHELATVLFCQLQAALRISTEQSPEELVGNIDLCFRNFDEIAKKHRLEKIKTLGYCYMCAGGLSQSDQNHPLRVVQAAIAMQRFLKEFKASRILQNLPWFEARIGIHSGPVVAGVVEQTKFSYDLWGDTMDIAARIKQMGKIGQVNLSADTCQHVKGDFFCRCTDKMDGRNGEALEVYLIEAS